MFQGADIGQGREWDYDNSIDWGILKYAPHARLQRFMADLGKLYRDEKALWEVDFSDEGFEWIDFSDKDSSLISFIRFAKNKKDYLVFVFNFTPEPREGYRLGVPENVFYEEILNSDAEAYYGSNIGNFGGAQADEASCHDKPFSISITLPPLASLCFRPKRG